MEVKKQQELKKLKNEVLERSKLITRPLDDRIIFLPITKEYETERGLIIPSVVEEKQPIQIGFVLRKGKNVSDDINPGDCMLYQHGNYTDFKWETKKGDGPEELRVLRESMIIMIIELEELS